MPKSRSRRPDVPVTFHTDRVMADALSTMDDPDKFIRESVLLRLCAAETRAPDSAVFLRRGKL